MQLLRRRVHLGPSAAGAVGAALELQDDGADDSGDELGLAPADFDVGLRVSVTLLSRRDFLH